MERMKDTSAIIQPDDWTGRLVPGELYAADQPLEVDVGCGKGRFLVSRAEAHPHINFLGIDRLLRRLRKVDRKIRRRGLENVRLLRIEASYAVEYLLPTVSVNAFYVLFPDPWPKRRHHRRRLFCPAFLDSLEKTLLPGGYVHVATDHLKYLEQIAELFQSDARFKEVEPFEPDAENERTEFELIFRRQGARIGRRSFEKK